MSIQYRVYKGNSSGGAVDYNSPLVTTPLLTFSPPALPLSSDTIFAVRAIDLTSGLEELNTDARVEIVVDGSGADVSGRPPSPAGVSARPRSGGVVVVEWQYLSPDPATSAPTGFKVWVQAGGTINYATAPTATPAYVRGQTHYSVQTAALVDATAYAVAVRATNTHGDDPNTTVVSVTADATGPLPVLNLSASPTY